MDQVKRSDIPSKHTCGQEVWEVFGSAAYIKSADASMAYYRFSSEDKAAYNSSDQGVLFVVGAKDTFLTYGESSQAPERRADLEAGTVLRVHKGEWYRFNFSDPDGFVELISFSPTPAARIFSPKLGRE